MEEVLKRLTEKKGVTFLKPADKASILKMEQKLNIELPKDYKEFLSISNGLPIIDDSVEPTFLPVEQIDYLRNIETYSIESFSIEGIEEIGKQLEESILIAGKDEEQYFLLIPPTKNYDKWKYWKFAAWIPGEEEFNNLESYFIQTLTFLDDF